MRLSRRGIIGILIVTILVLNLGCITTTMGFQVIHPWESGSETTVVVEFMQEMDPQYAQLTREANKDILAECAKSSVPCSANPRLPETLDEMLTALGGSANMTSDLEESGYVRVEWDRGLRYRRTLSAEEYLKEQNEAEAEAQAEGEERTNVTHLEIHKDAATGNTTYILEVHLTGMQDDDEPMDWAQWDAFRKEPDPPKPPIQAPPKEGEPTPSAGSDELDNQLALSGLDDLISGSLGQDINTKPEAALQKWHQLRIYKKMGYPTLLVFNINLPGELKSHTVNGQAAGKVIDGREVIFAIDEAFLRQYASDSPWLFRVETLVTPKMERDYKAPKNPTPEPAKPAGTAATTTAAPATTPKGPTYRQFRIRQLSNYAAGVHVGLVSVAYELQEIGADGVPGRRCRITFSGVGSVIGASLTPKWLKIRYKPTDANDWTEFSINPDKPAMRLEDFDGVQGFHSDAGAFAHRLSSAVFGTRESAKDQIARFQMSMAHIGLYICGDSVKGQWKITQAPE